VVDEGKRHGQRYVLPILKRDLQGTFLNCECAGRGWDRLMAKYVRIRLANGDIRDAALPQNETHTQWAAREFGAESRWAQTVEGTLVAKASIVEVSLVELDEQPAIDGVLPAPTESAEARAPARIFLSRRSEISRTTPAKQRRPAIDLTRRLRACRFRPRQSRRSRQSRP
jgi:hypothetical protein